MIGILPKPLPDRRGRLNEDRTVTPALEGDDVLRFKRLMGVCLADGCCKVAGHAGDHS